MNTFQAQLDAVLPIAMTGSIVRTEGLAAAVAGLPAPVGAVVEIDRLASSKIEAEVIGFRGRETIVYPLAEMTGVRRGDRVRLHQTRRTLRVGNEMLGRVIDARGRAIDHRPAPTLAERVALSSSPPMATERPRIDSPLSTGVRAIDGLLTCGLGQRIGIFSGSGVGKSVTLGMMARYPRPTSA
jgi:flagellum-specific ATP synthase